MTAFMTVHKFKYCDCMLVPTSSSRLAHTLNIRRGLLLHTSKTVVLQY